MNSDGYVEESTQQASLEFGGSTGTFWDLLDVVYKRKENNKQENK